MTNPTRFEGGKPQRLSFYEALLQNTKHVIVSFDMNATTYGVLGGERNQLLHASNKSQERVARERYKVLTSLNDTNSPLVKCLRLTEGEQRLLRKAKQEPELTEIEEINFEDLIQSAQRVQRALEFPRDQLRPEHFIPDFESIPDRYDQVEKLLQLPMPTVEVPVPNAPLMQCMLIEPGEQFVLHAASKRQLSEDFGESQKLNDILQDVIRVQRGPQWPNI